MVNQLSYCPRCDKLFTGKTSTDALEAVKKHVEAAHPDHDPEWADD